MSSVIANVIDRVKNMWNNRQKTEVEGYLMFNDSIHNKSLLLVKVGEKTWKTTWFNDSENRYKAPVVPLINIFNNKV
jgi:hypothetical protein